MEDNKKTAQEDIGVDEKSVKANLDVEAACLLVSNVNLSDNEGSQQSACSNQDTAEIPNLKGESPVNIQDESVVHGHGEVMEQTVQEKRDCGSASDQPESQNNPRESKKPRQRKRKGKGEDRSATADGNTKQVIHGQNIYLSFSIHHIM